MRRSNKSEFYQSQCMTIPEHVPLSQHVGQVLVVGSYPNQQKIEVTFVNRATRELRYKRIKNN